MMEFLSGTNVHTCSSFLERMLIIRSSSASYAFIKDSLLLDLVEDSLRRGGDIDMVDSRKPGKWFEVSTATGYPKYAPDKNMEVDHTRSKT